MIQKSMTNMISTNAFTSQNESVGFLKRKQQNYQCYTKLQLYFQITIKLSVAVLTVKVQYISNDNLQFHEDPLLHLLKYLQYTNC